MPRLTLIWALALASGGCSLIVDATDNEFDLLDAGAPDAAAPDAAPDGAILDGGDAGSALATPVLRFPWNGYMTGSAHTGTLAPPRNALRPRFIWEVVDGATGYELELSWRCEAATRAECAFDGAVAISTTTTDVTVDEPLEVSMTAPVGRRWYWRVRAIDGESTSDWSEARFLDVGRTIGDLDGDGYADVVTMEEDAAGDRVVRVFFGPALTESRPVEISSSGEPSELFGLVGDATNDGYPDVLLEMGTMGPCVLDGSTRSLLSVCSNFLPDLPGLDPELAAGGGDLDGDGHADIAIKSSGGGLSQVDVLLGSADLATSVAVGPLTNSDSVSAFGAAISLAGDLNGDGRTDLVIGSLFEDALMIDRAGRAHVYRGTASGIDTTTTDSVVISPTPEMAGAFGLASLGDYDGDGFADLSIIAAGEDGEAGADLLGPRRPRTRARSHARVRQPSGVALRYA